MTNVDQSKIVVIDYTNWEGKRSVREIIPTGELKFKSTLYHPEMQWILEAIDVRKGEIRHFALTDIHSINAYKESK
ncbi:hypothetical protein EVB32_191 [Rhizobium phage RHph_TM39]|nr:hypothetical protein PQC17_gp201 [Rhizobium phage RHph_Y65]QIG71671.1 hypothetical protein EVB94_200 [Rhizobium phage RHph_TM40]QIG72034.1 hypothetical protein EVB95_200 [Rhizobium phage RHph_TM2_3B]QIG72397.1 hypothetical protein EVB96_201 [Rhizobium phage RHph_TM3_3_6]QIG77179.1 hypothetical protein EVB32_191 [Rhizobium phage RHph_TM39]QIG77503.1 hypothetical protein EVB61_175 [Rhizobium phage RHph_TM21B]QIG77787.1 hypothetical protein EVB64_200 [Rhizobium phage RHph_TM61]